MPLLPPTGEEAAPAKYESLGESESLAAYIHRGGREGAAWSFYQARERVLVWGAARGELFVAALAACKRRANKRQSNEGFRVFSAFKRVPSNLYTAVRSLKAPPMTGRIWGPKKENSRNRQREKFLTSSAD